MAQQFWDNIRKIFVKFPAFNIDDDELKDLSCGICKQVMMDASQIRCGCQFCRICIEQHLINGGKDCPKNVNDECMLYGPYAIVDVHREKDSNMKLMRLMVMCPHRDCAMETEFGDIVRHWNECHRDDLSLCGKEESESAAVPGDLEHSPTTMEELKRKIEWLKKKNRRLEKTVEEMSGRIDCLERERCKDSLQGAVLLAAMANLEERVAEEKYEPFVWFIDEFSRRRVDGECVYSEPFFVYRGGYKMRLMMFPGGAYNDDRFVSVYFELVRGEYDPWLSWPFCHNVTFTVATLDGREVRDDDENAPGGSATHTGTVFYLQHNRNHRFAFERPRTAANIGLGLSEFVEYSRLTALLTNDSLCLRCSVEKSPSALAWAD